MEKIKRYVLMSIRPRYAKLIWDGKKEVEFRTNLLYTSCSWESVLIYETKPVGMVTGYVDVIVNWGSPNIIWGAFGDKGGIDRPEYDKYVRGRNPVFALIIYNPPHKFEVPVPLRWWGVDRPPQSWQYIKKSLFDVARYL